MHLLVFAHYPEAQFFLDNGVYDKKTYAGIVYYVGKGEVIVVVGEGVVTTIFRLGCLMAKLQEEYHLETVVNLGVAGALTEELKKGEVYSIRTCYSFTRNPIENLDKDLGIISSYASKMEFLSFSTIDSQAIIDVVTVDERLLDTSKAQYLENFAQLIDRELWGVGYVCEKLHLPFLAKKLVSDYTSSNSDCFTVREQARKFSEKLYASWNDMKQHFEKDENKKSNIPHQDILDVSNQLTVLLDNSESIILEFILSSFKLDECDLYCTISQKDRFIHNIKHLAHLYTNNKKQLFKLTLQYQSLIETSLIRRSSKDQLLKKQSRKSNMNLLLKFLDTLLDPVRALIYKKLNLLCTPLQERGVSVQYDKNLERPHLLFSFSVHEKRVFLKQIEALNQFNLDQFYTIFSGKDKGLLEGES